MSSKAVEARIEDREGRRGTLEALRALGGRATVADIVAATGLVQANAEAALRSVLATHTGHVEVGERGDLVYAFEPGLLQRDHVPWYRRLLSRAKRAAVTAFKVWIALTLVVYFVVFLALAVAALVAVVFKRDDVDFDMRGGRHISLDWLWFLFWTPDFRWGEPYRGSRWESLHGRRKVPFYKKVFAFVFGPASADPTQEEADRELVRLIRARAGVLTWADVVRHTGADATTAHDELGRMLGAWDGDARATDDGHVVYLFPDLMVSARGEVAAQAPEPAWKRLLPKREVTGNSAGANAAILGINTFNLAGVAAAALFLLPTLGLSGPVAWSALVWVPLVFSMLFFLIPLLRSLSVARENRRRQTLNVRRLVLRAVTEAALMRQALDPQALLASPGNGVGVSLRDVEAILLSLVAEFDGTVEPGEDGRPRYRFDALGETFRAGEEARRALQYERRRIGEVVYSSADEPEQEARREIDTFDRDMRAAIEAKRGESPD